MNPNDKTSYKIKLATEPDNDNIFKLKIDK